MPSINSPECLWKPGGNKEHPQTDLCAYGPLSSHRPLSLKSDPSILHSSYEIKRGHAMQNSTSKYYVTVFTLKIFEKESKTDPICKNPTHGKFVIQ